MPDVDMLLFILLADVFSSELAEAMVVEFKGDMGRHGGPLLAIGPRGGDPGGGEMPSSLSRVVRGADDLVLPPFMRSWGLHPSNGGTATADGGLLPCRAAMHPFSVGSSGARDADVDDDAAHHW